MTTVSDYFAVSEPSGRIYITTSDGSPYLFLGSTFDRRDWQDEADYILSTPDHILSVGHPPRFVRVSEWEWVAVTGNHRCCVKQEEAKA